MQDTPILSIEKEADLCNLFMKEFGAQPGWRCYPEAGGFDILAVHDDGRQLGVEAKMVLNAKVAEQILPGDRDEFFDKPGPDYRLVIVSKITPASAGIARMLAMLGVLVLVPNQYRSRQGDAYSFNFHNILEAMGLTNIPYGQQYLHALETPLFDCHVPWPSLHGPLPCWRAIASKAHALEREGARHPGSDAQTGLHHSEADCCPLGTTRRPGPSLPALSLHG